MLTPELFLELVEAASRAPSADNTQAWEFGRRAEGVEVFLDRRRTLPTDVGGMFGWVGLGAAIENLVLAASRRGSRATVEYGTPERAVARAAVVRLSPGGVGDPLAAGLPKRATNRRPYEAVPPSASILAELTRAARELDAGVHWVTGAESLARLAGLEANSTFIRLEHEPLHDELFDVLRFTREELERTRYGLDFESLEVPYVLVQVARQLRHRSVNEVVSRLGLGRVVAKLLAARLRSAGAVGLITARRRDPAGYMEAGRAMERIWLAAIARGLAAQPYGALPQYLTKVEVEPQTFLPRHAAILRGHREPFFSMFPGARHEHPAILLRVGRASGRPPPRSVRLPLEQLIRR